MNKKLFIPIFAFLFLLASLTIASAYTYYYPSPSDNQHTWYISGKSTPDYYKTKYYDKKTTSHCGYYGCVKSTTYTKTTRESPNYHHSHYLYDYKPWYQKYWTYDHYPKYGYRDYNRYAPAYYGHDYYYPEKRYYRYSW